jgi:hypothetical protein
MAKRSNLERVAENYRAIVDGYRQKEAEGVALDASLTDTLSYYLRTEGYTPERFKTAVERYSKTGGKEVDAGAGRAFLQGLSFGFADELEALIKSKARGTDYDQEVAAIRYGMQDYADENPAMNFVAETAGTLPYMALGGAGLAAKAGQLGLKSAAGLGALTGGATGAMTGLGTAEGDLVERLPSAAAGGVLGAGLGAATPFAAKQVGELASGARRKLGFLTEDQAKDAVMRKELQNLASDQVTPEEVIQRIQTDQSTLGPAPTGVIDVAGDNTRRMARGVQAIPGEGSDRIKTALNDRNAGQYDRISQNLADATGYESQDFFDLTEEIVARREQIAAPMFEDAFKLPPPSASDLAEFTGKQAFQKAMNGAKALADFDGRTIDPGNMTFRDLHYVKMALDDNIAKVNLDTSTGPAFRRKLVEFKNNFLDLLKKSNSDYEEAMDYFAGESALKDALASGVEFWKKDPRLTVKEIQKLTKVEKEMYLIGAMNQIRLLMDRASDSRDLVKHIFGTKLYRDKIEAVMPSPEDFQTFKKQMEREAVMRKSRDFILGNSQTARIQQDIADLSAQGLPDDLLQFVVQPKQSAINAGLSLANRKVVQPLQEVSGRNFANVAGRRISDLRPEQQVRNMEDLIRFQELLKQRRGQYSPYSLIGSGALGAQAGTQNR